MGFLIYCRDRFHVTHLLEILLQCADVEPQQNAGLVVFESVGVLRRYWFFLQKSQRFVCKINCRAVWTQ